MRIRMIPVRRLLLCLALGPRTYKYAARSLKYDPRLRNCRMSDIVVRKDGFERRIEADWLKELATIVMGRWRPKRGWPRHAATVSSPFAQNEPEQAKAPTANDLIGAVDKACGGPLPTPLKG
jgi:hypothetical protein